MRFSERRARWRGFSLVELLVTIGIIAVLIAILMPALSAARSQSRAVVCMSNVRQIAGAALMYVHDYKVFIGFPPDRKAALYPYLKQGKSNTDFDPQQVWHCPSNEKIDQQASYGFNTNLNWTKIVKVRNWSETVALGDGGIKDDGTPSTATHLWPPGRPGTASSCRPNHLRHPKQLISIGFVDGHAERMPISLPLYPGSVGHPLIGNNITDPSNPNYLDRLWDLQ